MVTSLEQAQELQQHVQNLDQTLKDNNLQRVQVPGEGDCEYLALIASGKQNDLDLGSLADVRILVFQGLMAYGQRSEIQTLLGRRCLGILHSLGEEAAGQRYLGRRFHATGSSVSFVFFT